MGPKRALILTPCFVYKYRYFWGPKWAQKGVILGPKWGSKKGPFLDPFLGPDPARSDVK